MSGGPDVRVLDAGRVRAHLDDLLRIESAARAELGDAYSHEVWEAEHFEAERPEKWRLSRAAFRDGRLVGFAIASRDGADAHVHRVAVAPRERGGAGGALMRAVESAAASQALSRIVLSVAAENGAALRFYERGGYRPLEPRALARYAVSRGLDIRGDRLLVSGHEYFIYAKTID